MTGMTRTPPATHGLLDQTRAVWEARGWDPAILDLFTMSDPSAGGGGDPGGAGGQGGGTTPPSSPPAPTPANPVPPAGPDLGALQTALDTAATSGRNEALQPLMAAIGVDTPEALQEWVTARHQEIEAGKDEATRAREAAEREAAEARAQAAQAQADARDARIDAALAAAQAPADNWADLRRIIDVPADGDQTAITAAVEAVKAKYPALFAAGTPGTPPPTPSTPPARPGQPTPPASGVEAGRERARAARQARQTATKDDLLTQFGPKPSPFTAN